MQYISRKSLVVQAGSRGRGPKVGMHGYVNPQTNVVVPAPRMSMRDTGSGKIYAPRNDKQRKYIELLETERPCIVVGYGTAGSGKTKLAVEVGLQKLVEKQFERIVITRPAVAVDEEAHGFLPGTLEQKLKPWIMPVMDCLMQYMDDDRLQHMIKSRIIEIAPLAYMRGRTFENAWIVCDEAQNMTSSQMLMMLTRIGKGSKIVFTGDPCQHDRHSNKDGSGLTHFLDLLDHSELQNPDIRAIEFTEDDVERHPIIPHILKMYSFDEYAGSLADTDSMDSYDEAIGF